MQSITAPSNNEALRAYQHTRSLVNDMIKARLAVKKNYERPKIRIIPNSLRAMNAQTIASKEQILNYVADVERLFFENKNESEQKKIDISNDILLEWNQLFDKALRDNQVGGEFLKTMSKEIANLTKKFISGRISISTKTKTQESTLNEQKDAVEKMIDDLIYAKNKTQNYKEKSMFDDRIMFFTKLLTTIDTIDTPLGDDEFKKIVEKTGEILGHVDAEKFLQIEQKKEKQEEHLADEILSEVLEYKDRLDGTYGILYSNYIALSQKEGKTNKSIESQNAIVLNHGKKISDLRDLFEQNALNMSKQQIDETTHDFKQLFADYKRSIEKFAEMLSQQPNANVNVKEVIEKTADHEAHELYERILGKKINEAKGVESFNLLVNQFSDSFRKIWKGTDKKSQKVQGLLDRLVKDPFLDNYQPNEPYTQKFKKEIKELLNKNGISRIPGAAAAAKSGGGFGSDFVQGFKQGFTGVMDVAATVAPLIPVGMAVAKMFAKGKNNKENKYKRIGGLGFPNPNKSEYEFTGPRPSMYTDPVPQQEKALRHFETITF